MSTLLACILYQHDLAMVVLAAVVCAAGCYAVVDFYHTALRHAGLGRIGWLFLTALTAGSSIWSTHFVAMLAYQPGVPVTYDAALTILSLFIAALGSGLGFAASSSAASRFTPALGGMVVGVAIAGMHYAGMTAFWVQGLVVWDKVYFVASIVAAVTLSAFAMHFATRRRGGSDRAWAIAMLFLAIVGLHFIGMAAMRITPLQTDFAAADIGPNAALALAIAAVSFLIIGMGVVSHLIEKGARVESDRRLRRSQSTDGLTGLPNRAGFHQRLRREFEIGGRIVLVKLDLDNFSEINDQFGHAAGDAALRHYARRMSGSLRAAEFIAHIGADEFAVLQRPRGDANPSELVFRLLAAFESPVRVLDWDVSVSASFGVAIYPEQAEDEQSLISNADLALSRAKPSPFERVCYYDPSMDEAVRARRRLAAELNSAIAEGQLEVFYQPQIVVATGAVGGFEALLRWKHPRLGYIPPIDFIPLAEENGAILRIGEWVLAKACEEAAAWQPPARVAVNISPVQFSHPDLPAMVRRILAETGLPAERLELELTESTLIADKARSLDVLLQLQALGATIAIDDFGTGYSSFDTLRSIPFDKIKLDRSFMREIETSRQAEAIFRAVVALGDSLGVIVLAEGVETEGQAAMLKLMRCGEAQGYLFGRPARVAALRPMDPNAPDVATARRLAEGRGHGATRSAA